MKKGYTLVEIILSIGLIVLVGTVSLISFNLIKKNNRVKALENMNDEILTALRLYIETNDNAKSKIYEDYEGMAITLETLQNEGLVDFGDLDVEDDYVVAMLSSESGCSDITTVESWDLTNGPLYICSKGGSQNLFSVGLDAENYSQATREVYYFKGINVQNYVQLNGTGTKYRIISIEKDDSLILYNSSSFNNAFSGKTQPISTIDVDNYSVKMGDYYVSASLENDELIIKSNVPIKEVNGETKVDGFDWIYTSNYFYETTAYNNTWYCDVTNYFRYSWIAPGAYCYYYADSDPHGGCSGFPTTSYKIHLKPCMKITGGSGDYATPYILENKC